MREKKVLKLVNDERRSAIILSAKGCDVLSTDICPATWADIDDCFQGAYDYCSVKDGANSACSGFGNSDICTIDTTRCGYGVSDIEA